MAIDDLAAWRADAARLVAGGRPDSVIALWKWERSTRRAFVGLDDAARKTAEVARLLEEGAGPVLVVARSGDTLQSLAARHLGDWRAWPRLLEANPGLAPGAVPSGTVLQVPRRR